MRVIRGMRLLIVLEKISGGSRRWVRGVGRGMRDIEWHERPQGHAQVPNDF